ncbi:GroES-like protein [Hyaloscypha bicolor E]|uniref:GroES-like protein n=1 Tax=Hyaloscypha bicolor E TaxID=1095630 RepID=A0A2J6TIY9_9HELO|nr:GroES-like protein [Hyaloscypha bicolor E]PMD62981.1 GroES-like protein [Hyaloscypha bicolor E]
MAPTTAKALVTRVDGDKSTMGIKNMPVPKIEPHQLLVRVGSVAQNPTDVQSLDGSAFGNGAVLGCDFAGTVEKLGDRVTTVKVGDRIAGLIWGGEVPGLGAYSQYTIADEKICFKVPENISSAGAATVPLAAGTAWLALYSETCLNISRTGKNATPILVWGGSSSVGNYTIQLARIYSIPVVTVCSPKNFDLCKRLGATHVFDYRDADVIAKIKSATPNIQHVFDTIGDEISSVTASQAVSEKGGVLCTVRPGKLFTERVDSNVNVTDVLVWTVFLKDHQYKEFKWPASSGDHALGIELFENISGWLKDGTLQANTPKVLAGGLSAIPEGFQMHRDGKISGFKLVYEL